MQQSYRLISYKDAVSFAHFPKNKEQVRQVERRIKYEELLKFQLKIQYLRHQTKHEKVGANKCFDEMKVEQFIHQLPFQLTEAQLTVLSEIKTDLMSPTRMNRLLQGDVGSGKQL